MNKVLNVAVRSVFGTAMAGIIILIFFFQNKTYSCKRDFILSNFWILAILLVLFALCVTVYYFYKRNASVKFPTQKINFDRLISCLTVILFFGQMYVFYNIFFLSGWDVSLIRGAAQAIASTGADSIPDWFYGYYSQCPNNLLLMYLGAIMLKINNTIGIFSGEYVMMCGVFVCSVINSATCYLVYKTANLFLSKSSSFIGYCLAVALIGISPWTVIFYSDSVGLIIPILSFYLYVKPIDKKVLSYISRFCAVFILVVGYFIKPQCVIMLIAIIGIEIFYLLRGFSFEKLKKPLAVVMSIVICYLSVTVAINLTNEKMGIEINDNKAFGMTHYMMMGLNQEKGGVYSADDVKFSQSFETVEERKEANIKEIVSRLKNMGVGGYVKHLAKKMLTTFNDGTFAWSAEGTFYLQVPEGLNTKMSAFLKSFYYSYGSRNDYFNLFAQIIWIIVLIGAFCSAFKKTDKSNKKQIDILWISVFGLILFECLFEVRARYLYTFAPIFCVLAILGLKEICEFIKIKLSVSKTNE